MRRYGLPGIAGGKGRRIAMVDSLMLGKNHRLLLVTCDGQQHLLAVGPQATTVVATQPVAAEPVSIRSAITPAVAEDFAA